MLAVISLSSVVFLVMTLKTNNNDFTNKIQTKPKKIVKKTKTKPTQIFGHEFSDNYQHQPYVHLPYAATRRVIQGKIYNPPGDRSNIVEDENYGIQKTSPTQCKNQPNARMTPFNGASLKSILQNQLEEYEIISKTFSTHLEDYPLPRKLNQFIPKDLCSRQSHHDRLLMCSPQYRAGEKRIIGINQPCHYFQYVAKTNCKFVDPGTGHHAVPGTIFNSTHWFHKDWSERGVGYRNQTVRYFDKIIAAPLTYWNTHSHLPLEFLPRLLYLLEVLPKDIPVIGSTKGFAGQYFKYMVDMKILDPKRIIEFNPAEYVFGKEVYFSREYPPCQNDCQRQYSLEFHGRLKRMMVPVDLPMEERDTIIYVHREGSRALSPAQANELEAMLKKYGKVVRFIGKNYPALKDVIDLFKKAKIVISTHGAGIANLLYTAECTTIVEMMYNGAMLKTPTAFYGAAISRKLDYWMTLAQGTYEAANVINIAEIEEIVKQVLVEREERKKNPNLHCWDQGKKNRQYIWDKNLVG
eukprot:gene5561-9379_t